MLAVDNGNGCLLQKQLILARYRILRPPRLVRNVPKLYTAKNPQTGQVLKFNIQDPPPYQKLWSKKRAHQVRMPHRNASSITRLKKGLWGQKRQPQKTKE